MKNKTNDNWVKQTRVKIQISKHRISAVSVDLHKKVFFLIESRMFAEIFKNVSVPIIRLILFIWMFYCAASICTINE